MTIHRLSYNSYYLGIAWSLRATESLKPGHRETYGTVGEMFGAVTSKIAEVMNEVSTITASPEETQLVISA